MASPREPRFVVGPSLHCSEGLPGEYNLKPGEPQTTTIVRMTDGWVEQCPDGVLLAASAWIPGSSSNRDLRRCQKIFLDWPPNSLSITAASSVPPGPLGPRLATRSGSVRPSVPADRSGLATPLGPDPAAPSGSARGVASGRGGRGPIRPGRPGPRAPHPVMTDAIRSERVPSAPRGASRTPRGLYPSAILIHDPA